MELEEAYESSRETTHGVQVGGLFVACGGDIIAADFECLDMEWLANITNELSSTVMCQIIARRNNRFSLTWSIVKTNQKRKIFRKSKSKSN